MNLFGFQERLSPDTQRHRQILLLDYPSDLPNPSAFVRPWTSITNMVMLNTTSPLPASNGPAPCCGPVEGHQAIMTAPAQLRLIIPPRASSKDPSTKNSPLDPVANAQKCIQPQDDSPQDEIETQGACLLREVSFQKPNSRPGNSN